MDVWLYLTLNRYDYLSLPRNSVTHNVEKPTSVWYECYPCLSVHIVSSMHIGFRSLHKYVINPGASPFRQPADTSHRKEPCGTPADQTSGRTFYHATLHVIANLSPFQYRTSHRAWELSPKSKGGIYAFYYNTDMQKHRWILPSSEHK